MTAAPESPVDLLRRATARMRENAAETAPSPWHVEEEPWSIEDDYASSQQVRHDAPDGTYSTAVATHVWRRNSQHIASWHPAPALAVADLLDVIADWCERYGRTYPPEMVAALPVNAEALAVARAYLGEPE